MLKRKLDDYLEKDYNRKTPKDYEDLKSSNVEQIAKLAAEKTVAVLTKGLLDEMEKLREDVNGLRKDIEDLKNEIRLLRKTSNTIRSANQKRGYRIPREIKDRFEKYGYILASEARNELNMNISFFRKIVSELENVDVIESGGDMAIINKNVLRDFKDRLEKLKTSDPIEASRNLGKYGKLFLVLRKGGLLIYDQRSGWRLLEV